MKKKFKNPIYDEILEDVETEDDYIETIRDMYYDLEEDISELEEKKETIMGELKKYGLDNEEKMTNWTG